VAQPLSGFCTSGWPILRGCSEGTDGLVFPLQFIRSFAKIQNGCGNNHVGTVVLPALPGMAQSMCTNSRTLTTMYPSARSPAELGRGLGS